MKKLLLLLLISSSIFAQTPGKIAEKITQYQKENKNFTDFSIFTVNSNYQNTAYKKAIENATIATLDLNKINQIVDQKKDFLEIQIPYLGENISVLLYKVDIKTEGFQLDTDKQKNVAVEKGVHYRGIIKNDIKSLVSFNFFRNQMSAIISGDKYSNVVVGKLKTTNNTNDYIIYSDATMKVANSFICSTKDVDPSKLETASQGKTALTNRCATIYFEMDYDLYQANNSNLNDCNAWMSSVFNNVQTIYANDNINVAFNSLFVWTSEDPYNGTSSFENLTLFHETRPVFNGDLGQLVGIDGGFGGVATAINGLCSENNFSYSDVFYEFNTVPTFSWTVQVITHELGHLLGSPHTHGCYWNGNNTSIDGCGPTANVQYTEGSCNTGPIPSGQTKGTIMSYCHLIQGVGISFNNGFGPQPAARIFNTVNAATCLGSDCITTCINKVASISSSNITNTTAKVSWTDEDTTATSWQVAVVASPFTANPNWTTVTDNPHTFTNLAPNTYYQFKVRKNCGAGVEGTSRNLIFATSDDFCAGRPFTDAEGNNNYNDNENWVRVVAPLNSNNKIKVVFTSIDLEDTFDFLYIHDGTDTTSPEITNGGLTGNTVPGSPFQATNASGALTFHFVSDPAVEGQGWTGNFSCVSLGVENNDFLDFSYYPNPAKNNITIDSKNEIHTISIYTIEGKLLYSNNNKLFNTTLDLSNYAIGTYIFKLDFENKPVTFKVVKQ